MKELCFMKNRDIAILHSIIGYCNIINDIVEELGNSVEIFYKDISYQPSIAFSITKIGGLLNRFSKEFIYKNDEQILFTKIISIRNQIIEDYFSVDQNAVWEIVTNDIAVLKDFCNKKL
jgi:uncharacterized protein with HEPN domain